ncbi:hypothetical protein FIM75_07030 [Helicobacter pylori]|nr:hypothetical protein FIM75_07030 [Helicobacter pylori]
MLQIFATKEKPKNYYLRWRDYSLKNLKMPKSVLKPPKNLRLIPHEIPFFFFFVKSAPIAVTLFP